MKCIELTQGRVAIVDDEDFDKLAQYRWQYNKGYADREATIAFKVTKHVKMHRIIMGIDDPNIHVDHINGDKLDNRRINLRLATRAQNKANSRVAKNNAIGVKGVSKRTGPKGDAFRAHITTEGKMKSLGTFKTAEEAHAAYCKAATEAHGEFARFN